MLFSIVGTIWAQSGIDALRYSQQYYGGSARFVATGSSFGALGGDLSTLSTNPAGIAIYRKGEMSITPSMIETNTDAHFSGNTINNNKKYGFILGNLGIASAFVDDDLDGWKGFSMGATYNRLNNYTNYTQIEGENDKGSMLDYFMLNADGYYPDDLDSYREFPAYDVYLLDTVPNSPEGYYTNPLWWNADGDPKYGQTQRKIIEKNGGSGEYALSVGANYNDFLYLGATMGIQSFYYNEKSSFSEFGFKDSTGLESFTYSENLRANGTGVNLKLGVIIRPVDFIRIGGAIHTPTAYSVTEQYSTAMDSYWNAAQSEGEYAYVHPFPSAQTTSDVYRGTYKITTPLRMIADAGVVIGNYGLLSAEYEYIDYSSMRMSSPYYNYFDENEDIRKQFVATHNFRGGAEFRLGQISLRGGYALYGNPYNLKELDRTDAVRTQISGGIGIITGNIYLDFAYVHSMQNNSYFLYNGYVEEPNPELTYKSGQGMVTVGVKF